MRKTMKKKKTVKNKKNEKTKKSESKHIVTIAVIFVVLVGLGIFDGFTGQITTEFFNDSRPLISCGEKITSRFPSKIILTDQDPITKQSCDSGNGVIIQQNHMVFDCNGYKIISSTNRWSGILLKSRAAVTIENCYIEGFSNGIEILHSDKNIITDNNLFGSDAAIKITGGSGNNVIKYNSLVSKLGVDFKAKESGNLIFANDFLSKEAVKLSTSMQPKVCSPNNENGTENYLASYTIDNANLHASSPCKKSEVPNTKSLPK